MVTASAAGIVTLTASEGGNLVSGSVIVSAPPPVLAVVAQTTPFYVAEGATFETALSVLTTSNSTPAAGAAVAWSGQAGLAPVQAQSASDANGVAGVAALVGPLAAGGQAGAQACVAAAVCAGFSAQGVGAESFALSVLSGAAQDTTGALLPVFLLVADAAGHAVVGATVRVNQTVTAYAVPCPPAGRCPAQPILASAQSASVSDSKGLVSVQPLLFDGTATATEVIATAGDFGYVTTVLTHRPQ